MIRAQTATANSNMIPRNFKLSLDLPTVAPGDEEDHLKLEFFEGVRRFEVLSSPTDGDLEVEEIFSGIAMVAFQGEQYLWEATAFRERTLRLLSNRIDSSQSYDSLVSAEAREAEIAKAGLTQEAQHAFLKLMELTDDDSKLWANMIASGYLKPRMEFDGRTVNLYEYLVANPQLQFEDKFSRAMTSSLSAISRQYRDKARGLLVLARKLLQELAPELDRKPLLGGA